MAYQMAYRRCRKTKKPSEINHLAFIFGGGCVPDESSIHAGFRLVAYFYRPIYRPINRQDNWLVMQSVWMPAKPQLVQHSIPQPVHPTGLVVGIPPSASSCAACFCIFLDSSAAALFYRSRFDSGSLSFCLSLFGCLGSAPICNGFHCVCCFCACPFWMAEQC